MDVKRLRTNTEPFYRKISFLKGNGARAVLLVVYGNREYEDTLLELSDVMEAAGFSPVAAVAAVAEHSIMHQFLNLCMCAPCKMNP